MYIKILNLKKRKKERFYTFENKTPQSLSKKRKEK